MGRGHIHPTGHPSSFASVVGAPFVVLAVGRIERRPDVLEEPRWQLGLVVGLSSLSGLARLVRLAQLLLRVLVVLDLLPELSRKGNDLGLGIWDALAPQAGVLVVRVELGQVRDGLRHVERCGAPYPLGALRLYVGEEVGAGSLGELREDQSRKTLGVIFDAIVPQMIDLEYIFLLLRQESAYVILAVGECQRLL